MSVDSVCCSLFVHQNVVFGASAEGLDQGFRVVINDGRHGSQSVYHLVPALPLGCYYDFVEWLLHHLLYAPLPAAVCHRNTCTRLTYDMCVGASTCTSWAAASLDGHPDNLLHGGSRVSVALHAASDSTWCL